MRVSTAIPFLYTATLSVASATYGRWGFSGYHGGYCGGGLEWWEGAAQHDPKGISCTNADSVPGGAIHSVRGQPRGWTITWYTENDCKGDSWNLGAECLHRDQTGGRPLKSVKVSLSSYLENH